VSNHFEFINKNFEMKLKLLQGEYGPSPSWPQFYIGCKKIKNYKKPAMDI
jgi:hypothetical protein